MVIEGEELTEQETALYDRQIRVWGADAQRRLSKSHVFVCGMKRTVAEFCKNIVLAGVGSLTLVYDRPMNEEALSANFFITSDKTVYAGQSVAGVCIESLKELNPMVRVTAEEGNILNFDEEYFNKFDIIVISGCSLETKKLINEKCRRLEKRVGFYTVDCEGSCDEIFVDLKSYAYSKRNLHQIFKGPFKDANGEIWECRLQYPSYEVTTAVPWKNLPKRMSKLYFALRVIEKFEQGEGRDLGETSEKDLYGVLKLRKELCDVHDVDESFVLEPLLARLIAETREFTPVSATIIGGIHGQAISGKGDPVKNFYLFDATDGKGRVEDVSNFI
uniref:THIF-type NAD/FAD binding fold domain-containing protein n=1 Tax=Kalanchoe fedtschenkoi TaxID=63787 RepID=A0A7N0RJF1_KALFE